ncbi:MAG TPA: hypothetical protein VFS39_01305 [Nitrospira sp.]|nr:hypothetical protein [Nitrospira sp.]
MAGSSRNLSEAGTDASSRALNEPSLERESLADRLTIWWISIGTIMAFLFLGLLLLEFEDSKPKVSTPIESAWY